MGTEYVALERRQLIDQLNETLRTETWAGDETNPNILSSALSVFLNVKKVFKRCSNLTRGRTLFAVHEVFLQLLSAYAKTLRERAQAACASAIDHRLPEAQRSSEIKTMCLIVNTAELRRNHRPARRLDDQISGRWVQGQGGHDGRR